MIVADFDEWMSGREWLGDKAPAEGFYGRYNDRELLAIQAGFTIGAELRQIHPDTEIYNTEWTWWLKNWAHGVGERMTHRLNFNASLDNLLNSEGWDD